MFIEVTVPLGTARIRAGRVESVCPLAEDNKNGNTMITLIGGEEWWVTESSETIMDRIQVCADIAARLQR